MLIGAEWTAAGFGVQQHPVVAQIRLDTAGNRAYPLHRTFGTGSAQCLFAGGLLRQIDDPHGGYREGPFTYHLTPG